MRRTLAALAGVAALGGAAVAATVAAAAPAAPAAPTPKISFRNDPKKPGYYLVTTTPASRLRVSLIAFALCDFTGQHCSDPEELDVRWLPKARVHSVAWGVASFWEQPVGTGEDGLYPGTYKLVMRIPGTKVETGTQFRVSPEAD